jgi:ABC-type Fe3+-siderophore transport system permease subunit
MRARSIHVGLPPSRGPSTRGQRLASRALLGVASAAGLGLCLVALLAPRSLDAGLPIMLLFYPLLWAVAIAVHRRV